MNKEAIIKALKTKPQSTFELMENFNLDDDQQKEFIRTIDKMLEHYEIVLKGNILHVAEQENIFVGNVKINQRGFGFVDFEDRESIFIKRSNLRNVYDNDRVVVQIIENSESEGKILKVLERSLNTIVGTILTRRKPVKFIADNMKYENEIKVRNADDFHHIHRNKVQLEVVSYEDGYILTDIISVLGHVDDPGVDIQSILIDNGIKLEWDQKTLAALDSIPNIVTKDELEGRRDLRGETIFTVDGADAKDLDDAISIKKKGSFYELGVHIADVSHYVEEYSPIDLEAQKRGTSVYVVDRVVSMLPKALSNGICSLNPNEDRLTISTIMKINQKGEVVDFEVFPSVINSVKRLTYAGVNKVLAEKGSVKDYEFLEKDLYHMHDLSKILKKKRTKEGAINFDKDEAVILVDKEGKPQDIVLRDRGVSEEIIEQFMVCTNETIAGLMVHSEYPALYRIHETPDGEKMRSFAQLAQILGFQMKGNMDDVHPHQLQTILDASKNSDAQFILSMQLLKSMQKARYSEVNVGHFGLSSKEYLHFTSPIRRYPDLIVHRMLRKYYFEHNYNEYDKDEDFVSEFAKITSEAERHAIQAERDVNDMKMAEYMQDYIGYQFEGIISSTLNFGMFIQLDNLVEGIVRVDDMKGYYNLSDDGFSLVEERTNKTYRVGDKVKVQVINADKKTSNIDFKLV